MKKWYLALTAMILALRVHAGPPLQLPSRDPDLVIPLLKALTPLKTYNDVLNILGKPDVDIGSSFPDSFFALSDGSRIEVQTRSMEQIWTISYVPPRSRWIGDPWMRAIYPTLTPSVLYSRDAKSRPWSVMLPKKPVREK